MRPAVKHRLGISYEDMKEINPRLVYGSISGFGQDGPYRERPGLDQIAQGMTGLMSVTGEPDGMPLRVGIAVGDLTAGNTLALAVMIALFERERTGRGRWVHTSLMESLLFMMDFQADPLPRGQGGPAPRRQRASHRDPDRRVSDAATATSRSARRARAFGRGCACRWATLNGRSELSGRRVMAAGSTRTRSTRASRRLHASAPRSTGSRRSTPQV
jgi:crotonobetainyl-CoA:carnitine CoA-transferase CaiB-like acyl-CoA transferase